MPISPDIRTRRRDAILTILAQRPVTRQCEFVERLQEIGIEATQSSVSRDLRELGIAKLGERYSRMLTASAATVTADVPSGIVRDIRTAGSNLTVIRTATGAAQQVALFLDRSEWPEVVGTISGDDTVFVATRNSQNQKLLLNRLRSTLQA